MLTHGKRAVLTVLTVLSTVRARPPPLVAAREGLWPGQSCKLHLSSGGRAQKALVRVTLYARPPVLPEKAPYLAAKQPRAQKLCSGWKTFTLDRRHNTPISRLLDLARLGSPCIHMTKLYRCSRSGGHVTSSTRCIPHLPSLYVGQHHHHYLVPPSAFGVFSKSKFIFLCQILRCITRCTVYFCVLDVK